MTYSYNTKIQRFFFSILTKVKYKYLNDFKFSSMLSLDFLFISLKGAAIEGEGFRICSLVYANSYIGDEIERDGEDFSFSF